ncbi:MAG: antitoxin MazE-like protein [Acidimicrobiales bacterium]
MTRSACETPPPLACRRPARAPGFAAEAHRQSALAAASPHEAEDQAFVDAISWLGGEGDDEE